MAIDPHLSYTHVYFFLKYQVKYKKQELLSQMEIKHVSRLNEPFFKDLNLASHGLQDFA